MRRTSCRDFARIVRATRALIAAPGPRLAPSRVSSAGNQNCDRSLSQNQPLRFHLNCEPRQTDRHVLAGSHRHGASHEARDSRY